MATLQSLADDSIVALQQKLADPRVSTNRKTSAKKHNARVAKLVDELLAFTTERSDGKGFSRFGAWKQKHPQDELTFMVGARASRATACRSEAMKFKAVKDKDAGAACEELL